MNIKEVNEFEELLSTNGYKKITSCKVTESDDYEYYKAFYREGDEERSDRLKYQIFFEFWDFSKYGDRVPEAYQHGVSITILPESRKSGRRDLKLSVDWDTDLEKVERVAEKFYEFLLNEVD